MEETRPLLNSDEMNAEGCARLLCQVLVNALENEPVNKDKKQAAQDLLLFAESPIVGHVCTVFSLDEGMVKKKLHEKAERLTRGRRKPRYGPEGSKTDPTWKHGNHTCCGSWRWWSHKITCGKVEEKGKTL